MQAKGGYEEEVLAAARPCAGPLICAFKASWATPRHPLAQTGACTRPQGNPSRPARSARGLASSSWQHLRVDYLYIIQVVVLVNQRHGR